jgi:hypothetical protein
MNPQLSEAAVDRLLNDLCVRLGFCLPPADRERLIADPPGDVDAFTDAVMDAEGLGGFSGDSHRTSVGALVAAAFARGPMRPVTVDASYRQWATDAAVLAEIGRSLAGLSLPVPIHLAVELADAAVAAWKRDDTNTVLAGHETEEQTETRESAANLALIGLTISETGQHDATGVSVDLDVRLVAAALAAVDAAGSRREVSRHGDDSAMTDDPFMFLQAWYATHCNGDWEHQYGVEVGTLDNPGWRVQIDVVGTELEGREQARAITERSDTDWVQSWCDGTTFHAAASPTNLRDAIAAFVQFATGSSKG